MTTIALILSVLVIGAAGGAGFAFVLAWRLNARIDAYWRELEQAVERKDRLA